MSEAGLGVAPGDQGVGVVEAEVGGDEVAEGLEAAAEVVVVEGGAGAVGGDDDEWAR